MFLKELYWKLRDKLFWSFLVHRQWAAFDPSGLAPGKPQFTIGIVTYIMHFDTYFSKLIVQLCRIFPDTEIIVIANGFYDEEKQKVYIERISALLKQYPNVKLVVEPKAEGLSKLWNKIITLSDRPGVLLLNDDLSVSPALRRELLEVKPLHLALINNSWSHFLILKKTVEKIGWFDERFTGIGNEDQDYEFRMAAAGLKPEIVYCNKIKNEIDQPTEYSYGKNVELVNNKYTAQNEKFLHQKWTISPARQEGMIYSEKFNLWFDPVPKLETPNFYPDLKFSSAL